MSKILNLFFVFLLFLGATFAGDYKILNPPLPTGKFHKLAVIGHIYEREPDSAINHTHFVYFDGEYKIIVSPFVNLFDDSIAYLVLEGESEEYVLYGKKRKNQKDLSAQSGHLSRAVYGCNAKVAFLVLGFATDFYLADTSVLTGLLPYKKKEEKILDIKPQKGIIVLK